jgi:peptidoglycan/LPS O-acetylase OafA/YrhL
VLFALVAMGARTNHLSLVYLPIFGLGVVMAQQMPWLDGFGERFDQLKPEFRRDAVMGVGLLLVARWWIMVLPYTTYSLAVGTVLTVLGACLLVWLFSSTDAGRSFGERRVCRWLGARSFSLYLVHEPIVVTVAYVLHGTTDAILVLVLALPLSLFAAELFGRMVEVPSHRFARAVGLRLQGDVPL